MRVGCCGRPCGGQEPGSRGAWLGRPLERSSPPEMVRQVARRDAVEAAHPALQPAVVGVHVLDVEGAVAHPNPGRDIDRLVADAALVPSRRLLDLAGGVSGVVTLPVQAARSMGVTASGSASVCQNSSIRRGVWPGAGW